VVPDTKTTFATAVQVGHHQMAGVELRSAMPVLLALYPIFPIHECGRKRYLDTLIDHRTNGIFRCLSWASETEIQMNHKLARRPYKKNARSKPGMFRFSFANFIPRVEKLLAG
jgi:hypothetical protein